MANDIELHSRVALVDGADNVYANAMAGTEGWVRARKTDDHGFRLVKIEWDKDHWRFNGQSDGWTFESHFKVIGPPLLPDEDEEYEQPEVVSLQEAPPSDDQMERYIDALTDAMDAASESEAFLTIVVRRIPNPDNPAEHMYVPQIFTNATSREGAMLLDIQLAECASQSYEDMILQLMERLRDENGK